MYCAARCGDSVRVLTEVRRFGFSPSPSSSRYVCVLLAARRLPRVWTPAGTTPGCPMPRVKISRFGSWLRSWAGTCARMYARVVKRMMLLVYRPTFACGASDRWR